MRVKHLPPGPFGLVAADPPWQYMSYSGATVPHRNKAGAPYPTMSLAELKALPVADRCAKDACLAMWILGSHTDQGFALAAHWGFNFNTDLFIWDKAGKFDAAGNWIPDRRMSFGKWSRKQGELCFLFTRGKPSPRPGSRGVQQIIRAERREHSRKPEEFTERCETLFHGPYLELFSRTDRPGWKSYGDEVGKFGRIKKAKAQ